MATDAFIAAFRLLHTNDLRQDAVQRLAQELNSTEWRTLQSILARRSFQLDIIGRLPVELVAHVFAYLDPSDPYRLQRVSRKWRHVLRSLDVLKQGLLAWSGPTPDLQQADYSFLKLKAKQIHAFRRGKPKHYFEIVKYKQSADQTILVNDTLIWYSAKGTPQGSQDNDDASRLLNIFNIRTWTLYSLTGDARELIYQIFASDEIVGFTTNNICYVSDLKGEGKKKMRVPTPILFQSLACRERTVACAGILTDHALVYIWSYDTQQGRSFTIDFGTYLFPSPRHGHQHGLAILLQPKEERITVFTDQRLSFSADDWASPSGQSESNQSSPEKDTRTILYGQFTYRGKSVFESEMTMDDVQDLSYHTFQSLNNTFTPVNDRGVYRVSIGSRFFAPAACWLQFDEGLNEFTEPRPTTHKGQLWAPSHLAWWKDTFFSIKLSESSSMSRQSFLVHLGTDEAPHDKPLILRDPGHTGDLGDNDGLFSILLNDRYLVRTLANTFQILCYDDPASCPIEEVDGFFDIGSVEVVKVEDMPHTWPS